MASTTGSVPSGATYTIVPTKDAQVAQELWWSHMLELGWNRSYYDLASYISATNSRGFLLLYPDESDRPQGHVMATVFDNQTAWIAMFITAPSVRRHGFGKPLFQAAMDDLVTRDVKYCGLDAVAEQVPTYARRGFVESEKGRVRCMLRPFGENVPEVDVPSGWRVRGVEEGDLAGLVRSERRVIGFERKGLWSRDYLRRPDVEGLIVLDESRGGDDALLAWVFVRRSPGGARLGPVYARDAAAAKLAIAKGLQLATPERDPKSGNDHSRGIIGKSPGARALRKSWICQRRSRLPSNVVERIHTT
ncbi:acyl-CoA N-acyltransferase [Elsinoe ampelina]|uniref:Acyl-CoA N-acyltransferase n=1 Tax=Elsinoe ampelina TaxID=302913 RepID=A0A6A6GL37_9PEZI|nr:acyl-CoA N-acyltransferase [Elsinoe ampelina]